MLLIKKRFVDYLCEVSKKMLQTSASIEVQLIPEQTRHAQTKISLSTKLKKS